MKRILIVSVLALGLASCGGKADVRLINNTSRYVDGSFGNQKFGLNVNGSTNRTVDWDGFFKNSTDAEITYRVHSNWDGVSSVVATKQDRMKLESGASYEYEIYFNGAGQPSLRIVNMHLRSITAP